MDSFNKKLRPKYHILNVLLEIWQCLDLNCGWKGEQLWSSPVPARWVWPEEKGHTHMHVNMGGTTLCDPLTVRLCLLSKSWTREHSHACTEVHPRKSPESSQCDCCFVRVLVCVQRRDTELWVSLLWIWCAGLIGPDHKRISSLQPRAVHPQSLGAMDWSDYMVEYSKKLISDLKIPEKKKKTLFYSFTTQAFWNIYLILKWSTIIIVLYQL